MTAALLLALGATACGGSASTNAGGDTATQPGADPATRALLTRLAIEGSDAVFDQRFGGALDAGGEAGPLVFAGRAGAAAVLYVCDGTTGTWFAGATGSDGAGRLPATDGSGTVSLTPVDGGLRAAFDGGAFAGRSTTVARLADGDGMLLRLEAPAATGGPDAAVGGVIVSPAGVRGALATSITDGSSNTLLVGESGTTTTKRAGTTTTQSPTTGDGDSHTNLDAPTGPTTTKPTGPTTTQSPTTGDGDSHTNLDAPSGPTTTKPTGTTVTTQEAGISDGTSNTIVIRASNAVLTVRFVARAGTATTTSTAPSCSARDAVASNLVQVLTVAQGRAERALEAARGRGGPTSTGTSPTGANGRSPIGASVGSLQRQLDALAATIDATRRLLTPCPAGPPSTVK